jgi:hypothetical protein
MKAALPALPVTMALTACAAMRPSAEEHALRHRTMLREGAAPPAKQEAA